MSFAKKFSFVLFGISSLLFTVAVAIGLVCGMSIPQTLLVVAIVMTGTLISGFAQDLLSKEGAR